MDEKDNLMNEQFKKMIEQENAIFNSAKSIADLYNGLLAYGLPEQVAADFVKTVLKEALIKKI